MNLAKTCDKQLFKKVVNHLRSLGCCDRCVLRYMGFRIGAAIYDKNLTDLRQDLARLSGEKSNDDGDEIPSKRLSVNICSTCLGMLQNGSEADEMEKIALEVEKQKYVFASFTLSLTVPVNTTLRNQVLLSKLAAAFPQYSHTKPEYVTSVKDVWRTIISKYLAQRFAGTVEKDDSPFAISVHTSHDAVNEECSPVFAKCPNLLNVVKCKKSVPSMINGVQTANHYNHTAVARAVEKLGAKYFEQLPLEPPTVGYKLDQTTCLMESVYLAGRYNKLSRKLSQTPWFVDGVKLAISSVQEIIAESISHCIKGESVKFSASGREDVDVRMLGDGRPFIIEIINPFDRNLSEETVIGIEEHINAKDEDVKVRDLQLATKQDVQHHIKDGATEKQKYYAAYCCASRPLTQQDVDQIAKIGKDIVLDQKTPIRVLHRRSLATRKRTIASLKIELDASDPHRCTAFLVTEAGTYIKEFVHSDFGRTTPSLATLIGDCKTDILHLDVMGVFTEWPPSISRQANVSS